MLKMHLKQPGFTDSACGLFLKNKEIMKKLKKQEIQDIFIKANWIKLVFNIIWLMKILKIETEEQPLATVGDTHLLQIIFGAQI